MIIIVHVLCAVNLCKIEREGFWSHGRRKRQGDHKIKVKMRAGELFEELNIFAKAGL